MTPVADRTPQAPGTTGVFPWTSVLWFGLLLILCYWPVLTRLVNQWETDEDMGHGFFVPAIAGYIVWSRRDDLATIPAKTNYWGLALVLYAAVQLVIATLGAELFLARTAFIFSIIGSVLFIGGWNWVRALAFPLFLLFFMVPIPAILYNQITFPLQQIASRAAEFTLTLIGIPVFREGNILELPDGQRLQVVEACSGIRSLLTLTFLSLVYGYFFEKRTWIRVVLFLSTVPIAIIANAGRVTITGFLANIDPELSRGFFHTASGWMIFMIALIIMAGVHQAITRFYSYLYAPRPVRISEE